MKEKRILVDMSVSLLHHGHIRLLQKAKELGRVIVALTSDEEIVKHKGYQPELNFQQRKEMLLALNCVDEVVPCTWLIDDEFLRLHQADLLVHSGDNPNPVSAVCNLERTQGVSTTDLRQRSFQAVVEQRNSQKVLLTPGPSNLHPQNLFDIRPVFTRGDAEYSALEQRVLGRILRLCGQDGIVALQGSATTGIEIATSNFLCGRVAVILSGYYSLRILHMLELKSDALGLTSLESVTYQDLLKGALSGQRLDWVVAVYTETADAFLADMRYLKEISDACQARLMIDATGSINLEKDHELADVCMFSSCKGLGGLTGAAFITYNQRLLSQLNSGKKEFMLDLKTHLDKMTTAPAHALCSLDSISADFDSMQKRVVLSKDRFMQRYARFTSGYENQPALCTKLTGAGLRFPDFALGYEPRTSSPDTQVICHLFDQFPSNRKPGDLYDLFESD